MQNLSSLTKLKSPNYINMKIKTLSESQGFTIIEVLIVIATMGMLLIFAIFFVAKDPQKANFTVTINGIRQQMEEIISETSNGYYPNNDNFTCNGYTSGTAVPTFSGTATQQGQNATCVFLGKLIQFAPNHSTSQYAVIPVVGNNYISTSASTYVKDVSPVINWQYSLISQTFQYGINTQYMKAVDASTGLTKYTSSVAFLAGDASGDISSLDSSNYLNSGSLPLNLYYDGGPSAGGINLGSGGTNTSGSNSLATDVNKSLGQTWLANATSVMVCLTDGSKSGLLTFGGSGSLSVTLKIYNDSTCI